MPSPRQRTRDRAAIDERWFAALRAAATTPAYRAALAAADDDEERATRALVRGFRDAWRRRARRPAGRLAADWVIALVVERARGRWRPDHFESPPPVWHVAVPPEVISAVEAIPEQSAAGSLAGRWAGILVGAAVLAGMAMVTVGLAAVLGAR